VDECWFHEFVFIQRPELCVSVGYVKLCVDKDLIHG